MSYRERLLGEVVRIDEEYQREQHARLRHEEELESHLAACLGYYRCPLPLRAEEVLELPFQEMSRLCYGDGGNDKAKQQHRGNQRVSGYGVWHGIARYTMSIYGVFGPVNRVGLHERVAMVKRLGEVARKFRVSLRGWRAHGVVHVQPVFLHEFIIGPYRRVLLPGRRCLGQPR